MKTKFANTYKQIKIIIKDNGLIYKLRIMKIDYIPCLKFLLYFSFLRKQNFL